MKTALECVWKRVFKTTPAVLICLDIISYVRLGLSLLVIVRLSYLCVSISG